MHVLRISFAPTLKSAPSPKESPAPPKTAKRATSAIRPLLLVDFFEGVRYVSSQDGITLNIASLPRTPSNASLTNYLRMKGKRYGIYAELITHIRQYCLSEFEGHYLEFRANLHELCQDNSELLSSCVPRHPNLGAGCSYSFRLPTVSISHPASVFCG